MAAAVVARTQHRDRDFLSGFVFVAAAAVAQAQHPAGRFFFGWVCFCGVWRTNSGGGFLTVDGVLLRTRQAGQ